MLKEKTSFYYKNGYNCAESLLRGANDAYALDLDENALKVIAGFGGGMQTGDVCGALAGCIAVISSRCVQTKAHDTPSLKPMIQQFIQRFEQEFRSIRCHAIKPLHFHPQQRCLHTVCVASDLLEAFIREWDETETLF